MTQRSLIAVVNARSRQSTWAQAIRDTWLSQVPADKADAKFFVGNGEGDVPSDTVALNVDDSYHGLPGKVQAIAGYAYEHGYEYVLKLDDDVVVKPSLLLSSDYNQYPYTGRQNRRPNPARGVPYWVPMGFAYWMNRDCMKAIMEAPLPTNNDDERWVAECLYKKGIELHSENRYHLYMGGLLDRPLRANRPLRIGRALHDDSQLNNGFAWAIFMEVGGLPQRIPIETKIAEYHKVFQKYGEPKNNITALKFDKTTALAMQ